MWNELLRIAPQVTENLRIAEKQQEQVYKLIYNEMLDKICDDELIPDDDVNKLVYLILLLLCYTKIFRHLRCNT